MIDAKELEHLKNGIDYRMLDNILSNVNYKGKDTMFIVRDIYERVTLQYALMYYRAKSDSDLATANAIKLTGEKAELERRVEQMTRRLEES